MPAMLFLLAGSAINILRSADWKDGELFAYMADGMLHTFKMCDK